MAYSVGPVQRSAVASPSNPSLYNFSAIVESCQAATVPSDVWHGPSRLHGGTRILARPTQDAAAPTVVATA